MGGNKRTRNVGSVEEMPVQILVISLPADEKG
jgi:hypothetical protein